MGLYEGGGESTITITITVTKDIAECNLSRYLKCVGKEGTMYALIVVNMREV